MEYIKIGLFMWGSFQKVSLYIKFTDYSLIKVHKTIFYLNIKNKRKD